MSDFFTWLSGGSPSAAVFIIAFGALIVGIVLLYVVAFIQGRSVSFWPPKIGEKPRTSGNNLATKSNLIVSGLAVHNQLNLEERLHNFRTLELVGYNLSGLLHDIREPIAEAVIRGAFVRIILVDFTSPAGDLMKIHSNRPHSLLPDAVKGLEHIADIQRLIESKTRVNGKLEVKLTSWIPSCNFILIDANELNGIAKIGINPISFRQPTTGRVSLILDRKNFASELNYFMKSFEALWEQDSKVWNGKLPQIENTVAAKKTG